MIPAGIGDLVDADSCPRPFVDSPQPPPLKGTVVETVEFPEEDESIGEILVAFFGPSCNDVLQSTALNILMTYLCGSSVSVIENVMVEKEELASSVAWWSDNRPNSVLWFQPTGVATEKLAFVEQRLIALLKEVASKPLDMKYMNECIQRERRQIKFQAEGSEQFYSTNLILDYLFGKRDGSTLATLQFLKEYDTLEKWTDEQWREFLRTWISDAHHISILGKPSLSLATSLKEAEKARLAKRREELGEEGLARLKEKLEAAKENNEKPIPSDLLDQWPVPETSSIHFIESATARSGKARSLGTPSNDAQKVIDAAPQGLPLFVQFENVPTNFVHLSIHLGASETPVKYKPLIPLFADNFFNSPVMRNGQRIEFEDVVKELEQDTISYQMSGAGRLGDYEGLAIQFQVEPDKYQTTIDWLRTLMFDMVFDPVRLKAAVVKALADIPEAKRDGRAMAQEVDMAIHLVPESYPVARRTLVKAVYLRRLKKLLEKDPETVVSWFEGLRRSLFNFENIRVLVTADVAKLPNPVAAWDKLFETAPDANKDVLPITNPTSMLSAEGKSPGAFGSVIIPMTTLKSSYSVSTATGLSSYSDPRLPAYLVALGYLEAVEGPLWNAVRGNGFAYGQGFSRGFNDGYTQYRIYRSPDASKALEASKVKIGQIASGEEELDRHLVEVAVSGIVLGVADEQATMAAAAQQNFVTSTIRGLDPDWSRELIKRVRDIKADEIRAVMNELIMPLFEPGKSNVVVTCAPLMEEVSFGASGEMKILVANVTFRASSSPSPKRATRRRSNRCRTFTTTTASRATTKTRRMTMRRGRKMTTRI